MKLPKDMDLEEKFLNNHIEDIKNIDAIKYEDKEKKKTNNISIFKINE